MSKGGCLGMSKSGGVFQIDDVTRAMSKGGGACECPRVGAFFKLMTSRGTMSKGGARLVFHPSKFRPPHLAGWLRACYRSILDSLESLIANGKRLVSKSQFG